MHVEDYKKFEFIEGFLDIHHCEEIANKMDTLYKNGKHYIDSQCPISDSFYSIQDENLLQSVSNRLEKIFEVDELFYTFDYARIYRPGEILRYHRDRLSCQYSVTINLRNIGSTWDFHIKDEDNKKHTFTMNTGDAVIYTGCTLPHWRDAYEGDAVYQCFMHFCDRSNWPTINDNEKRIKNLRKEKYLTSMKSFFGNS